MSPGPAPLRLSESKGKCVFSVKVVPRSSRNQVVGIENGELKIKITAPPLDDAANEAVLAFLAAILKLPKSSLGMVKGSRSRHKILEARGITALNLMEYLQQQI